jgi:hypothetical protein
MGRYTLIVNALVLATLRGYRRDERTEVRRLLGLIQLDPSIDNIHKIVVPRPPAIFAAYVTSRFWIFYRLRNTTIIVDSIERATDLQPPPR